MVTAARIITPFRAVNNAGDVLSRQNFSCGGTCQSFQSRPGLSGLRHRFGSNTDSCIPSAVYSSLQLNSVVPASACNVKFVYDGSDYTTYWEMPAGAIYTGVISCTSSTTGTGIGIIEY